MAKKFLVNIDLNSNLLLNPILNPLATPPTNAKAYYIYTSTATADKGVIYCNVGTYESPVWQAIGAVTSVNGKTGAVVLTQDDVGDGTTYVRTHNDLTTALVNLINGALQTTGGTMSGAIAMGNNKITGLADGTVATDAAAFGQIPVASSTTPEMDGTASAGTGTNWARADHVHPSDTSKLSLSGGTMSGAIAMGSNKVTGLATGTADGDAVNVGQLNEAINQASASFKGSFASYAALMAVAWQSTDPTAANYVTNNDYAYVADDETHDDEAWRYIYSKPTSAAGSWTAAYMINEAPFTQAQLDAINSGATTTNIGQIGTNTTNIGNTQKMLADAEANATAASAHAIGDYFIYNNKLYQATSAIAIGDTITPNTNCTETTIESILATKAPLASPALTGTPTAPTAATGTNTTQIATTAFVQAAVSAGVKTATGTIGTSATSVSVNYTSTATLIRAYATQNSSEVVVDITYGNGSVTFSVAEAPSSAVTCIVVYA